MLVNRRSSGPTRIKTNATFSPETATRWVRPAARKSSTRASGTSRVSAEKEPGDQRALGFRHGAVPGEHPGPRAAFATAHQRRRRTGERREIVGRERADRVPPTKARLVRIEGTEVAHETNSVAQRGGPPSGARRRRWRRSRLCDRPRRTEARVRGEHSATRPSARADHRVVSGSETRVTSTVAPPRSATTAASGE